MEIKTCPFCGKKGLISTEYESDENSPNGYNIFVECENCGARGGSSYCVNTSKGNLSRKAYKEQVENQKDCEIEVINYWNIRI